MPVWKKKKDGRIRWRGKLPLCPLWPSNEGRPWPCSLTSRKEEGRKERKIESYCLDRSLGKIELVERAKHESGRETVVLVEVEAVAAVSVVRDS